MWEGAGWRSPCAGGAGVVPWVQQLCPAGASPCHCQGLVFAQSMAGITGCDTCCSFPFLTLISPANPLGAAFSSPPIAQTSSCVLPPHSSGLR